ncbi:MAG: ribonuclease P protein subunit [archaeon]
MFEEKYRITEENILAHELNGLKAEVKKSSDKKKEKISGKVVKETKNLFVLETKKGEKRIPKKETEIEFEVKGKKIKVKGKNIMFKPEDRIKMFWRKKDD